MPSSIGKPRRRNGWSERANTTGSTGRMQGLAMVSTQDRLEQREAWIRLSPQAVAGLKVSATPFMQ
jgi:hypothetical protein